MGFSANNLSKSLMINEENLTVTREYRLMLMVFTRKVLQKSTIISPLVRNLSFLDPNRIIQSPNDCRRKLTSVLKIGHWPSSCENWSPGGRQGGEAVDVFDG